LEGIKTTATGVIDIIANAEKLATEGISAVEKASVILGIISAVIKVASGIFKILRSNREAEKQRAAEQAELMQNLIDLQTQYNLALNDTLRLQTEQSIFFTDNAKKITDASIAYQDAERERNAIMKDLLSPGGYWVGGYDQSLFGSNLFQTLNRILIQTNSGIKSLISAYPELIDANGELNISLAETILTSEGLSEERKRQLTDLTEWSKKMAEAQKQMDDAISEMIGNLGNDIYKALSDAWDNSTDSFLAFKDTVSQGLEDLAKQMIFNAIWANDLEQLKKDIAESYSQGGDQSVFDDFERFFSNATENVDKTNKAWAAAEERAAAAGFDWTGKSSESGISKGIQSVTEDTARRLEGLINSIRETTVHNLGNTDALVRSNELIQAYSGQSLAKLTNIDNNIAAQLALFNSLVGASGTTGLGGLRVVVQ
jgi:hypothetical protein